MALGPATAPVTVTEYASMTCGHCAHFNETVFPKIKSEYIDSGKIRYVFREFPLDIKAAAGSMLARCIAKDDAGKYFAVIDMLFKQQTDWVAKNTTETLMRIGKQAGLSEQAIEDVPEGSGAARQDRRRPEVRQRSAEGQFDADLFHQWRDGQGRDLVRGIRQEDQGAAEELIRPIVVVPANAGPIPRDFAFLRCSSRLFTTGARDYGSRRSPGRHRGKLYTSAKLTIKTPQNPWEKPWAAVALRPRPRHCRGA